MSDSPAFELLTLGSVELRDASGAAVPALAAQPRRLALLVYLAVANGRGFHRRDTLLALFWPEWSTDRGRNALNQAVHFLRRALGPETIVSRGDELGLAPGVVACDVHRFERAMGAGRFAETIAAYGGPFLDGFHVADAGEFEEWADGERRRLAREFAGALDRAAEAAVRRGESAEAARLRQRLAATDRLSERLARAAATSLATAGEHEAAVRELAEVTARVRRELGRAPERETERLLAQVEASRAAVALPPPPAADVPLARSPVPAPVADATTAAPPPAAAAVTVPSEASPPAVHRPRRVAWLGVAAVALVLVVGATMWAGRRNGDRSPEVVAVLPFVNESDDPAVDRLGRVVADHVAQSLSHLQLANVVGLPEVLRVTVAEGDVSAPSAQVVSRETGATLMVSGAIYRVGDRLEAHARIVRTADGTVVRQLRPVTVDARQPGELLRPLAGQLTGAVAVLLDRRVADGAAAGMEPPNLEAYHAFVNALELVARNQGDSAAMLMLRAGEADTTFVQPFIYLADIGVRPGDEPRRLALRERARAQRDRLAPFDQAALDRVLAFEAGDHDRALRAARRMTELAPRSPDALFTHALSAWRAGYYGEGRDILRRIDLERGWMRRWSGLYRNAGTVYHAAGDFASELQLVDRARAAGIHEGLELCLPGVSALAALGQEAAVDSAASACASSVPPNRPIALRPFVIASWELRAHGHAEAAERIARRGLAWHADRTNVTPGASSVLTQPIVNLYLEAGDPRRGHALARQFWEPVLAMPDGRLMASCMLGTAAARAGDRARAIEIGRSLVALDAADTTQDGGSYEACRARIAAALGDRDEAVRLLREAWQEGAILDFAHRFPEMAALHGYPPFDAVIASRR